MDVSSFYLLINDHAAHNPVRHLYSYINPSF
jgi:hypothetical protein